MAIKYEKKPERRETEKKSARCLSTTIRLPYTHTHTHTHNISQLSHPPYRQVHLVSLLLHSNTHRDLPSLGKRKTVSRRRKLRTITYYKISRITSRITNHSHTLTTCNPHSIKKKERQKIIFSGCVISHRVPTHKFTEYRFDCEESKGDGREELPAPCPERLTTRTFNFRSYPNYALKIWPDSFESYYLFLL